MRDLLKLPWDACVHSARQTALTNLGLTGADPFTLQRAAGHADLSTTRKYVHPTPESLKSAFQKKEKRERNGRRKADRKKKASSVVIVNPAAELNAFAAELRQKFGLGDPSA
jgi:hypothetical protein